MDTLSNRFKVALVTALCFGCSAAPSTDGEVAVSVVQTLSSPLTISGIRGQQSNRCVDRNYGQDNANVQAHLWDCDANNVNQPWILTTDGQLQAKVKPSQCLTANGAFQQGTPVITAACNGGAAQKWTLANTTGGFGTITLSSASNLCLDAWAQGTGNGTPIVIGTCNGGGNQSWALNGVSTPPPPSGPTLIVGQQSSRCVDRDYGQDKANVPSHLWDCDPNNVNQPWILGSNGALQAAAKPSQCMTVAGAIQQGATVTTAACSGLATQAWVVGDTSGGFGTITLAGSSGMCLDASGQGTGNGTPIVIGSCTGGGNQKWKLSVPTTPPPTGAKRVLFVRGADASGGFLEATNDTERTEQLADINNTSTSGGNHGWGQWAAALRADGFTVDQVTESNRGQTPFDFVGADLTPYSVIVLGSNNAPYGSAAITKVQDWIRAGGGLLTTSDANFGYNYGAAPTSDTSFLQAFGVIVNQDSGVYALRRDSGDFLNASHPILNGVNVFDGEGVSPCTVTGQVSGVSTQIVVRALTQKRLNNNDSGGSMVDVNAQDGSLIVGSVQNGRFACTFDRNTFFNTSGAGTDITHNDNLKYARNLIAWLAKSI